MLIDRFKYFRSSNQSQKSICRLIIHSCFINFDWSERLNWLWVINKIICSWTLCLITSFYKNTSRNENFHNCFLLFVSVQDELQQLYQRDLLREGEQRREYGWDLPCHLLVVRVLPSDRNRNRRTHRKHLGNPDTVVGKDVSNVCCHCCIF